MYLLDLEGSDKCVYMWLLSCICECVCVHNSPTLSVHPLYLPAGCWVPVAAAEWPAEGCRHPGHVFSVLRLRGHWASSLCGARSRPVTHRWLLSSLCFYILFEGNQIYPAVKILADPAHGWCGQQSRTARTLRVEWYTATQVWFTNIYRYIICLYEYLFIQNLSSLYNVELWRRLLVPM